MHRTVWASVEPLSGREFYERDQTLADVTHRITIRWDDVELASMTTKDRGEYDSRTFEFTSIRNIEERGRVGVIMAKEAI